ncbi:hypothetical protein BN2475_1370009 [Paraburkholderia ribeironis]|uniref:Uncharacterized protein n=1 Tax=Paraburkholderia ribeironis TaxID=1247936 RepID=A0A1N7SPT5_9BURK|nr:hypothetical protein [Paraburkholderia ribeironis]SIT49346.1 hypothetical protein BN2475_1370009 [Paraburkholderia ribeironis]
MNDISLERFTGTTTTRALDFLRKYSQERGGVMCAQVSTADLPVEIEEATQEVACICLTTPPDLELADSLLDSNRFELYNETSEDGMDSQTTILVGGAFALNANNLSIFENLESSLPVVFVHKSSWAIVAYPWDRSADGDAMQCAMMSSGQNFRPLRHAEQYGPMKMGENRNDRWQDKMHPTWYGHLRLTAQS